MDYNQNQNFQTESSFESNPVVLKEKESNKKWYYWVLFILLVCIIGWFGYTAGWFSSSEVVTPMNIDKSDSLDQIDNLAQIDNITIETLESFPVQKILSLKGNLNNGCMYLNDEQVIRDGNSFYITLSTRKEGDMCTEALVPFEKNINLDVIGLPAGVYRVIVNGIETSFELEQDNLVDFNGGIEK